MSATVIAFPIRQVDVHEIATRMWELTMLGERDSDDFRTLEREFRTRCSGSHAGQACAFHA